MIEMGKMRVERWNIGGVSNGTIIYRDNIMKRHRKKKEERITLNDSKALSIIIPEVVGKIIRKHSAKTSV